MVMGQLTGLIPVVLAGGIALKFTESLFPQQPLSRRRGTGRRGARRRKAGVDFGSFSMVGKPKEPKERRIVRRPVGPVPLPILREPFGPKSPPGVARKPVGPKRPPKPGIVRRPVGPKSPPGTVVMKKFPTPLPGGVGTRVFPNPPPRKVVMKREPHLVERKARKKR